MPAERIPNGYVHGYSKREHARLLDQATTLTELLHHDTCYPPGASVLEAGCDVGAQTITLARNIPWARFISIDVSLRPLEAARARVRGVARERHLPGGGHLRAAVSGRKLRPRLRLLRARAPAPAARGVREQALAAGLVEAAAWARGVAGLRRAAEPDGVFCHTFFKGVGVK